MRGKRKSKQARDTRVRNIPAYAGKTIIHTVQRRVRREHPRVCGENAAVAIHGFGAIGTSPRMRGKQTVTGDAAAATGNIPAYAGKTQKVLSAPRQPPEHPRVCGENLLESPCLAGCGGTSPRMRGKPPTPSRTARTFGNIPAYAGKTGRPDLLTSPLEEHPRVCGENIDFFLGLRFTAGTSPRMRGKLLHDFEGGKVLRNIPAYAGKTTIHYHTGRDPLEHPRVCGENRFLGRVFEGQQEHPRVCGENPYHRMVWTVDDGTSPRMRGKR